MATPCASHVLPKMGFDGPDRLLEQPGREAVVLNRPVVAIGVENGIFVIDAKERTFIHQSTERRGLEAFRRSVPWDEAADTSVVERPSSIARGGTGYEYVPVLRTKSRRLMPISLPVVQSGNGTLPSPSAFVTACSIARQLADHLGLEFVEPACPASAGTTTAVARVDQRNATLPSRAMNDDFFAVTQMQTAFAAFVGLVGVIAVIVALFSR